MFIYELIGYKVVFKQPAFFLEDVAKILLCMKDEILRDKEEQINEEEMDDTLFKQFIKIFLDMFYLATRDLNELKHQVNKVKCSVNFV